MFNKITLPRNILLNLEISGKTTCLRTLRKYCSGIYRLKKLSSFRFTWFFSIRGHIDNHTNGASYSMLISNLNFEISQWNRLKYGDHWIISSQSYRILLPQKNCRKIFIYLIRAIFKNRQTSRAIEANQQPEFRNKSMKSDQIFRSMNYIVSTRKSRSVDWEFLFRN